MSSFHPYTDLSYPHTLDYLEGICAVESLPRAKRIVFTKGTIPPSQSAAAYIKSRRWIKSHAGNCQCVQCRRKYKMPLSQLYREDFHIKRQLGAGAFGATALLVVDRGFDGWMEGEQEEPVVAGWSGYEVKAGQIIAVKRIPSQEKKDPTQFLREIKALQALEGSGHVINILGFKNPTRSDPWGHIFMPYCSLGDCHVMMDKYYQAGEHVPETFLYRFTLDMSRALQWLNSGTKDNNTREHWLPWTHNDIKPNNVLMKARSPNSPFISPIFVLADLGLACDSHTVAPGGCLQFLSPQRRVFMGTQPATHKDDMYALGVSVYLMANYDFPYPNYQELEETEVYSKYCLEYNDRHRYCNPYSLWFNNLITGLTSLNPDERITAAEAYQYMVDGVKKYGVGGGGSRTLRWDTSWVSEQAWQRFRTEAGMGGTMGKDVPERLRVGSGRKGSYFNHSAGKLIYHRDSMAGYGY